VQQVAYEDPDFRNSQIGERWCPWEWNRLSASEMLYYELRITTVSYSVQLF